MMPILVIGAVVAVALAFVLIQKGRMVSAWSGRVESIERKSVCRDECGQTLVVVRYRTEAGRRGKFELEAGACARYFPGLKEGDRLIKTEEEALPRSG
jgi:hypothetical protein